MKRKSGIEALNPGEKGNRRQAAVLENKATIALELRHHQHLR